MDELVKERIFYYFNEISKVPRGSGFNQLIRDFLVSFAVEHKLSYTVDEYDNVLIRKDASAGCESCETVILQGHMDMVCVNEEGVTHDFHTEPLALYTENDYIKARGTSLGGDDGIELAYALAILENETYVHPSIEALFTTDEECGYIGANHFDLSLLKGTNVINIDSEEEGTICVGCAGGGKAEIVFQPEQIEVEGFAYKLMIAGLQGGHSGVDINVSQDNATKLLFYILRKLQKVSFHLKDFFGGNTDNVIPSQAEAMLVVDEKNPCNLINLFEKLRQEIFEDIQLDALQIDLIAMNEERKKYTVIDNDTTNCVIQWVNLVPNGVQKMSTKIIGAVETSLSMGCAKGNSDTIEFQTFIRSSVKRSIDNIIDNVTMLSNVYGAKCRKIEEHPVWQVKETNQLADLAMKVYKETSGRECKREAIHAGLECAVFAEKCPQMNIISIGADTLDIHSTNERLSISSSRRTFQFLLALLERLTNQI